MSQFTMRGSDDFNNSTTDDTSLPVQRLSILANESNPSKVVSLLRTSSEAEIKLEVLGSFSFLTSAPTTFNDVTGSMTGYKLYVNSALQEEGQFSSPRSISPNNNPPTLEQYSGNDTFIMAQSAAKNDVIYGYGGNDRVTPGLGDDYVNGGSGIDTVVLSGRASDYALQISRDIVTVTDSRPSRDGSDTLINVERLEFSDKKVAVDIQGNAGQTAKILNGIFGAAAIQNKEYVGIGLSLLDGGMSYSALIDLALTTRLGQNYSVETMIGLLHTNMGLTAPASADTDFWQGRNTLGMSKAAIAESYIDSSSNRDLIDFAGMARTGLEFL